MKAKTVHESMGNVLKPKSDKEIGDVAKELILNAETDNVKGWIDSYANDDDESVRQIITELENVARMMGSDPKDVYISVEEQDDYEKIDNLLRRIAALNRPMDYDRYYGEQTTYSVSPKFKIAFGNNNDFDGLNIVVFDKEFILNSFDKWAKSQT